MSGKEYNFFKPDPYNIYPKTLINLPDIENKNEFLSYLSEKLSEEIGVNVTPETSEKIIKILLDTTTDVLQNSNSKLEKLTLGSYGYFYLKNGKLVFKCGSKIKTHVEREKKL